MLAVGGCGVVVVLAAPGYVLARKGVDDVEAAEDGAGAACAGGAAE